LNRIGPVLSSLTASAAARRTRDKSTMRSEAELLSIADLRNDPQPVSGRSKTARSGRLPSCV
jgi:hypothetical protein